MAKKSTRVDVVYSTNPDFVYSEDGVNEQETIDPGKQVLHVMLDKKARAGKEVTLVTNFIGTDADLEKLGKTLKAKCGAGGSVKDRQIIIQGDFRDRVMSLLADMDYRTKRVGG